MKQYKNGKSMDMLRNTTIKEKGEIKHGNDSLKYRYYV